MSKVHSVPRKQGRRLAGTDFVHFGVESLFARKLRACMNGIILSFPKQGVKMTCIISKRPGPKLVWILEAKSENGCKKNDVF